MLQQQDFQVPTWDLNSHIFQVCFARFKPDKICRFHLQISIYRYRLIPQITSCFSDHNFDIHYCFFSISTEKRRLKLCCRKTIFTKQNKEHLECPAGRSDEEIDPCENGQWKRKTIRTHLGFLTHDLLNDQSSEYCIGPSWPEPQGIGTFWILDLTLSRLKVGRKHIILSFYLMFCLEDPFTFSPLLLPIHSPYTPILLPFCSIFAPLLLHFCSIFAPLSLHFFFNIAEKIPYKILCSLCSTWLNWLSIEKWWQGLLEWM